MNQLVFPKNNTENASYSYSSSKILKIKTMYPFDGEIITFGILPIFAKSNESLFYSFYHLAVSFKYFVLFAQKSNLSSQMNHQLWKLVINSIIAGSPFFYTHLYTVLMFLDKYIKIEMTPENISMLDGFKISNSVLNQPKLQQFIFKMELQVKNKMSIKLEKCILNDDIFDKLIILREPLIRPTLNNEFNSEFLIEVILSILLSKNTKESPFPFYLVFLEWAESFLSFPPCEITPVSTNSISITFIAFVPDFFQLISKEIGNNTRVIISDSPNFQSNRISCSCNNIETKVKKSNILRPVNRSFPHKFYIKFESLNVSNVKFIVTSNTRYSSPQITEFIYNFKRFLFIDFDEWTNFSPKEDRQILDTISLNRFSNSTINTRLTQGEMINIANQSHRTHLFFLRGIYLITINILLMKDENSNGENRGQLGRFILTNLFVDKFTRLVAEKNGSSYERLTIDRQIGLDYRNGLNRFDRNSMIGQFTREYIRNPSSFRNPNTPFRVDYRNEEGIDAGGLMRDFFTELTCDINTPKVGLFIQTPNGRNHEGEYQDSIVPAPAPEISLSDDYYRAVGALLGIAIRSEMKQPDIVFSPFIWSFIITGKIEIEDVYSIDKSFMDVTRNLLTSSQSMTSEEFDQTMSSTVVTNIRGAPIEIDLPLTKANCQRFIAMCNEFRLNELKRPLNRMRIGFWENLAINVPLFVTPSLLESLACGNRIITVDELRRSTVFNFVEDQQKNFFWEVVSRMSNDERKKLIHFITGLNSIGKNGLSVDSLGGRIDTLLPTASTCFFRLHLPSFSSADKMFNAFILAINETGTFERG